MRRLESIEQNKIIKRNWYIQGYDLETIKELKIPTSDAIKTIIDFENMNDLSRYLRFTDDISFDFIRSQKWMLDEIDYINMNVFELDIAIKSLTKEYHELLERFNYIKDKDELEETRTDLIINNNHYQSLVALKNKKEEENKKRK